MFTSAEIGKLSIFDIIDEFGLEIKDADDDRYEQFVVRYKAYWGSQSTEEIDTASSPDGQGETMDDEVGI